MRQTRELRKDSGEIDTPFGFAQAIPAIKTATGSLGDADRAAVLAPLARMSIKRNTLTIYYEAKETTDDRPSINASTNTSADDTSG
ncbi:MAG: hypothetical protein IIC10_04975 [Proteobacteria bacterium]|nr:hypothetical protein [Pseudomonadota bacterium]